MWDKGTWTVANDILYSPQAGGGGHFPSIAIDRRGFIHVIFTGGGGVYYSRAYAGGDPWKAGAWSRPIDISDGARGAHFCDIEVDVNGYIHAAWGEPDPTGQHIVHYSRSTDGGDTWSVPLALSGGITIPSDRKLGMAQIFSDPRGTVYVVWNMCQADETVSMKGYEGFFARSEDGGANWTWPSVITEGIAEPYWLSGIAYGDGNLIVTIRNTNKGGTYFRWSSDGGLSWSDPGEILEEARWGWGFAFLAIDSEDNLYTVLPTQLDYARFDGETWATFPSGLALSGGGDKRPRIIVTAGNRIHLIWSDVGNDSGAGEVYHAEAMLRSHHIQPAILPTATSYPPFPTSTSVPRASPSPSPTLSPITSLAPVGPDASMPDIQSVNQRTGLSVMLGVAVSGAVIGIVLLVKILRSRDR
jgi:hypothetical protein